MNILIDIGHPAHVHLLKNVYRQLIRHHHVWVTVRDIPIAKDLLTIYQIPFTVIGVKGDKLLQKAFSQLYLDREMALFVRQNNIQLGIGSSVALAHVAKVTAMQSIILDDDDD